VKRTIHILAASVLWYCPPESSRAAQIFAGLLALGVSSPSFGATTAQWDFNGDLASSIGGANLVAAAAPPATVPGVAFTNMTIGGQQA
jgi:hypothetical protein